MLTPVARRKFSQRRGGRSVVIQRGGQVGGRTAAAFAMEAAMRGSDRVGMRVHLALAKLNVSQILLRTQSGAGSHIRGCL